MFLRTVKVRNFSERTFPKIFIAKIPNSDDAASPKF